MIKSENKSERALRSASPHRNAYKSDFHSIKCSFDGSASISPTSPFTNGGSDTRGRTSGDKVSKIKNIFLQMDGKQNQDSPNISKPMSPKFPLDSTPYRSSLSSVSSLDSASFEVRKTEDVSIDKAALAEKFSMTRKLFESGLKEQSPTERSGSPKVIWPQMVEKQDRKVSATGERNDKPKEAKEKEDKEKARSESETPLHKLSVSMNAGPISRRLESFMLDSDSESLSAAPSTESHSPISHSQSPSAASDHSDPPSSPDSCSSPTSYSLWADSPAETCLPKLNGSDSHSTPLNGVCTEKTLHNTSTTAEEHIQSSEDTTLLYTSEKIHHLSARSASVAEDPALQEQQGEGKNSEKVPGLATVRAELVVVKTESSESEGNEEEHVEDNVFEEAGKENQSPNSNSERVLTDSEELQLAFLGKESKQSIREHEEGWRACEETVQTGRKEDHRGEGKFLEENIMDMEDEEEEKNDNEEVELKTEGTEEEAVLESVMRESEQKATNVEDKEQQDEQREGEDEEEDEGVEEGVEAVEEDDDEREMEDVLTGKERQQHDDQESTRKRSLICGIENAAFVDDKDNRTDLECQVKEEFQECEELPGLSDEEDLTPKRKIKFSTAPIKVYFTFSNEDYDRSNDDVDPVSASAEYELEKRVEKMDVLPIDIQKGNDGLGISIIGMGVGADQGLEKLGIFVKTITEGGAAHRDGRIWINDQIVEVDGISLVGVTQLFAATTLKNTKGLVKFLIGREKPGVESEVARLISETLQHESSPENREPKDEDYHESQNHQLQDEKQISQIHDQYHDQQETEPLAEKSVVQQDKQRKTEKKQGAEDASNELAQEVFSQLRSQGIDLPEDIDPAELEQKFKELHMKHSVTITELNQLKEKLQVSEAERKSWETRGAALEMNVEESKERIEKLEKYWLDAQALCKTINQRLNEAQSQHDSLQLKYNTTITLLQEHQQREAEFTRKEAELKRKLEQREREYKSTVKQLQHKIACLEGHTGSDQPEESCSPAGESQPSSPTSGSSERNGLSTDDLHSDADWGDVPQTARLDCSVYRAKAKLAQGSQRKRPSRSKLRESAKGSQAPNQSQESVCIQDNKPERTNSERRRSYLESLAIPVPSIQFGQSQTPQGSSSTQASLSPPKDSSTPQSPSSSQSSSSMFLNLRNKRSKGKERSKSRASRDEESDGSPTRKTKRRFPDFSGIRRSGGKGKKRESITLRGSVGSRGSGELLDESSGNASPSGSISSIPSCMPFSWFGDREKEKEREREKERSASSGSLPRTPSETYIEDRANKTNLSWPSLLSHSLDLSLSVTDDSIAGSPRSVLAGLLKEPRLLGRTHTHTFSSCETLDDGPLPAAKQYMWQSRPLSEWTNQQVCHWLMGMNMEQYIAEFTAKGVDGQHLLCMDSSKLKELGVSSQRDRSAIKRRLKDMKKAQEKLEKQQVKKEKERGREKEAKNKSGQPTNLESAC
ncbi:uncharacterized protein ppp1r9alb [Garra rufa]|uniref:uncharacterized protein ppp1r9alb n=1 Tax=Garra rufa TaxID=137080 RepID=UPI003CCE8C38